MVYIGFKVGTWGGGWPNLASEKLKTLRVIDKLVAGFLAGKMPIFSST